MIPPKAADVATDALLKALKNQKLHAKALESAGAFALTNVGGRWSSSRQLKAQRRLAEQHAWDIEASKVSHETVLGGNSQHTVVWSDGVPVRAYPAWEGDLVAELAHFRRDRLVDPPQPGAPGERRRWRPEGRQSSTRVEGG